MYAACGCGSKIPNSQKSPIWSKENCDKRAVVFRRGFRIMLTDVHSEGRPIQAAVLGSMRPTCRCGSGFASTKKQLSRQRSGAIMTSRYG